MTVTADIQRHLPGTKCTFVRTVESAVTTAWGVRWNEMQIARDVLQNFYDGNKDQLDKVKVTMHQSDVWIDAPAQFKLERLFYLGSEKTSDDIGEYGEGFKAATVCLLRDHGVNPVGISGTNMVHVRLSPKAVDETRLQPLLYDFYTISPACEGAMVFLPGCSPVLARELQQGMAHFFSEQNALLGSQRWESWDKQYALYQSKTGDGYIFYRRLKRATIVGIPVVLAIHKPNARIDKKVQKDRDRNAFEDAVLDLCYDVFAKQAASSETVVQTILNSSTHLWERGHPLLSKLAHHWHRDTRNPKTKALFANRYYAASSLASAADAQLEYQGIEAAWKTEGRRQLPAYFAAFGVPSAESQIKQRRDQAITEQQRKARSPSRAEQRSMDVLNRALGDLDPVLTEYFRTRHVRYSVAETEAILGALKTGRGYQSIDVFLSASVFTGDFARALAIFLHEHAHVYGHDASRGFTDALTELIEATIRHRQSLDAYENDWQITRQGVLTERGTVGPKDEQGIATQLLTLDRDALLRLLERVPRVVLRPLLSGDPDTE
jgi:hypothetical protein